MSLDFLQKTSEFKRLLRALESGEKNISLTGLADAAKPFFLASLAHRAKKRIVFIEPHSLPSSRMESECRFFLTKFSSPTELNVLPELADSPYEEVPPSLDAVSSRMKTFHGLLHPRPSLTITNLPGFLKPVPRPEVLKDLFIDLSAGNVFERDYLLRLLEDFGYAREDLIASAGEFAYRGGIVDVFSPWESYPFRIEYSGDDVVSLREFDTSTQRSLRRIDRITIPSLREYRADGAFLEAWGRAASKKAAGVSRDCEEKTNALITKEFFPSFVFLAHLVPDGFAAFPHDPEDTIFIIDDPEEVEREWRETLKEYDSQLQELQLNKRFTLPPEGIFDFSLWDEIKKNAVRIGRPAPSSEKNEFSFPSQPVPRFENKIPFFLEYLRKMQDGRDRCFIFLSNQGIRQKLAALLTQNQIEGRESSSPFDSPAEAEIILLLGDLARGFSFPAEKIAYFAERDIFTEDKVLVSRAARARKPFLSQFQDLKEDDHVVHTDYGIGLFKGLVRMDLEGRGREFMELHYRDEDKLYVPVEDLNLVQKYSAVGDSLPLLDKLGTINWQKTKERAKKAIESMAKELLELYARRKAAKGFSFSPAGTWESEFEKTFEFEETEDQARSIAEIQKDLESDTPMDRLLCGDVGYGKTEVAMRAAFKAAMDGKQVAVLCPTTVLASQHLKTFRNRMVLFPVRVEALTRLQSRQDQRKIVEDLKKGLVDIVIGTHRLLSRDVGFHDLGLLIVDEEQRFGVSHKEKIKMMKANVDVLTMTATPIPRTLNMSLSGIRDISLIETPPKDRMAVHTVVTAFNAKLVALAVKHELNRDGQVYYVHNRIEDIDQTAFKVQAWSPQARPVVIHGSMTAAQLEKRMMDFIDRKHNVLVSTTIIENGIDIPLVNTLIVDRADRYGLSQLYQLRGRVGRSSRQAYAYFLVPPFADLTPLARKRLKALQEFSELGSGFRLAAKDLEIRGAGNFLGSQQHGCMEAVGFDYFMHLLDETIQELKGERIEEVKAEINLKVDIRIPESYLPQINLRLNLYKRISSIEDLEESERIGREVEDRFGPLPAGVRNLLLYGNIRLLAQRLKVRTLDRIGTRLILKFYPSSPADLKRMTGLIKKRGGSITPQGVLTLNLAAGTDTQVSHETILILKELYG